MVNWNKRVASFDDNRIKENEELLAVGFLQPEGALMKASMSYGIGGIIGMFVGSKMQKRTDEKSRTDRKGMAKDFPGGNIIAAVTNKNRVIIYEQNALSGKPKKYLKEYTTDDFVSTDLQKRKLAHLLTVNFKGGGVISFDIARGQDIETFIEALATHRR